MEESIFLGKKLAPFKEETENLINELVVHSEWINEVEKNVEIQYIPSFEDSSFHARFYPDTQIIQISSEWVGFYAEYMSLEQSKMLHEIHELFHAFEMSKSFWYEKMPYWRKTLISEYCAKQISKRISRVTLSTNQLDSIIIRKNKLC